MQLSENNYLLFDLTGLYKVKEIRPDVCVKHQGEYLFGVN